MSILEWRKSSHSPNETNCVELAAVLRIRDRGEIDDSPDAGTAV